MGQSDKSSSSAFPWKEFLALLGVLLAAYIGYLGIRYQIEYPISVTQTAEAKLTENANIPTMTLPPTATILPLPSTPPVFSSLTPTPLVNSGIEFLNHYYSCINNQ